MYYKKVEILQLENYELVNAFERTVDQMTKAENFTKYGVTPKMRKQFEWIREELLTRMR